MLFHFGCMLTAIGFFYDKKTIFLDNFKSYYSLKHPSEAAIQASLWLMTIIELPVVMGICQLLQFHVWLRMNNLTTFDYIMAKNQKEKELKEAEDFDAPEQEEESKREPLNSSKQGLLPS